MNDEWERELEALERNIPECALIEAVYKGTEEEIRQNVRLYCEEKRKEFGRELPEFRGIFGESIYMELAILSGSRERVKLLLELGFRPVFYHGSWNRDTLGNSRIFQTYEEKIETFREKSDRVGDLCMKSGNYAKLFSAWPIADEDMFRMQITAMKDIDDWNCISIYRKEWQFKRWMADSWQMDVTPALFTMLTGNTRRLLWLLSRGADLDCRNAFKREPDIKPLLNPFSWRWNFYGNPLETAILSGDPAMVTLAVEHSEEAAFYWNGGDVKRNGPAWYPRPWQYGQTAVNGRFRMERAVCCGCRSMWELLLEHFQDKIGKIPLAAVLDMGGGALADLLFERRVEKGDGTAHMEELEQWASACLGRSRTVAVRDSSFCYFLKHRDWYTAHMTEAYMKLRSLLFAWAWRLGEQTVIGGVKTDIKCQLKMLGFFAGWSTDISAMINLNSWEIFGSQEKMETVASCLKQLERDWDMKLTADFEYLDLPSMRDEQAVRSFLILMCKNQEAPEHSLEQLLKFCDGYDTLLPEQAVASMFQNGYVNRQNYMELLQKLEEQSKYDMMTQLIMAGNENRLAEGGAARSGRGAGYEAALAKKTVTWQERDRRKEHALEIYQAIRRTKQEQEAKLLCLAGNPQFNRQLMDEMRSSGGRFLETRVKVRFWNQVGEFEGYLNLLGIAIVLDNCGLVRDLLAFWKELEQGKCNPRSAYVAVDELRDRRTAKEYLFYGQYRMGAEAESPGGIIAGDVFREPNEQWDYSRISMDPAALAIAMGRLELVEEMDHLKGLSSREIQVGLLWTGDRAVMDGLWRQGAFETAFLTTGSLAEWIRREGCRNLVLLSWLREKNIMTQAEPE